MKPLIINAKNLRALCGLNGFRIRDLAAHLGVSESLLYRAADHPDDYPARYAELEKLLPIRQRPPSPVTAHA